MRILVTGGAGFLGSTLSERLIARGHEVVVVDDLSSGKLSNLKQARREGGLKFHQFDIRLEGVRAIIEQARPEVVVHLAAQVSIAVSVRNPIADAQTNSLGLLNVLEASVTSGVTKVVYASSGGAIYGTQKNFPVTEKARGRPISPYGISKASGEDYLRFYRSEHGLDFMSLAPANIYGPRQDPHGEAGVVAIFSTKLLAFQEPTIFGNGLITRDYVFVDDVAHAFALACERGSGETVNIGTGIETNVNTLYRMIAEAAGSQLSPEYGPPRPGDLERSSLDPTKASKVLGWKPWTPLADGLRQTVAWFGVRGSSE